MEAKPQTCSHPECSKQEGGEVQLKKCSACKLVSYCGTQCQRGHWKEHKSACKEHEAMLKRMHRMGQAAAMNDILMMKAELASRGIAFPELKKS
ncbi:hypothetical protein DFP72DRAFT_911887 [Ephemerocybe angulata]|uniref:MYND-type domain-containing protein n=1 Tax=Ephemerocybe angulata TaxID=980116 RepID=A0A8H6HNP2_9AGAR|nr:hypothetical protein DFP72DRAFT_911887 [Tulosesus angulatus]